MQKWFLSQFKPNLCVLIPCCFCRFCLYGAVSGAGAVNSSLLVQHDNLHPDQDQAIEDTLEKLRAQPAPVMAIIPGAGM